MVVVSRDQHDLVTVERTRAVQYLRMSSEHQKYSLANQADAIAEYAALHQYDVVRTYADHGRSGLTLKGRKALEELLADARNPERDFSLILVLDVSRWGRFQDPDESASYEYQCREAGVNIEYCAEGFFNEGTFISALLKQLKRLMAAEYSRELSHKTWVGQCAQAALGFKQGGQAIYGFRRMLIDEQGMPRGIMKPGETKYTAGDRVLYVHGPAHEIRTIKRIFRLLLRHNYRVGGIAKLLNQEDLAAANGERWTCARIRNILKNPLCIGIYAFNRTSTKLGSSQLKNPESEWVTQQVLAPIVSEATFARARRTLEAQRSQGARSASQDQPSTNSPLQDEVRNRNGARRHNAPKVTDPDRKPKMLKALKRLLREKGELNYDLIGSCAYTPSGATYARYFGTLGHACELIGYKPDLMPRHHRSVSPKDISDEQILGRLREIYGEYGHINAGLVKMDRNLPTLKEIRTRFGSLMGAYLKAGLESADGQPLTSSSLLWTFRRSSHSEG